MNIHLPTLLLALTLSSSVLAASVLTVAWRGQVHRGLSLWGLALVVNALSYPAFALRAAGWPETSILATNLFTALTMALQTRALMVFQRGRARVLPRWAVWAPVGLNLLAAALLMDNDHWRNVLAAGLQAVMAFVFLWHAWAPGLREPRVTGRLVLIAGTAVLFAMLVARTVLMVRASDWDGRYGVPDSIQASTYLAVLGVLLVNSMGFVLMQMEQALARQHDLAIHDGLTGVHNRVALLDALKRHLAQSRRSGTPLALLMIDIDHFKAVNDRHGHLAGDEVLRQVARLAGQRLRHADFLARYGGEEFLALLPGTDAAGARVVAEAVRQGIAERPMLVDGQAIAVTVSVGVCAAVPGNTPGAADALIAASDQALYQAKAQGRNRVVVA